MATQNIITVGSVLTAYLCFSQLIKPLEELHRILDELSECMVLAEDFFRMTELPSDFSYTPVTESTDIAPVSKEMIDLTDVTFCYKDGEPVLNHLNLKVKEGMFLGIAGPSGCGKSSLIKAICKLEKCSGDILVDGKKSTLSAEKKLRT